MSMYRIEITEEALDGFITQFNSGFFRERFKNIHLRSIESGETNGIRRHVHRISVMGQPVDVSSGETGFYQEIMSIPLFYNFSENGADGEFDIVRHIIDLEAKQYDEEGYLDEGEQSELSILYSCLGRELTDSERKRIEKTAKEYLGEDE